MIGRVICALFDCLPPVFATTSGDDYTCTKSCARCRKSYSDLALGEAVRSERVVRFTTQRYAELSRLAWGTKLHEEGPKFMAASEVFSDDEREELVELRREVARLRPLAEELRAWKADIEAAKARGS